MKNFKITSFILFMCLCPISLYANGTYYIGKDEGGIYFQTDHDGGWYIDKEDLRYFKVGEKGTYSIGKDRIGNYLITDKRTKFYLDTSAIGLKANPCLAFCPDQLCLRHLVERLRADLDDMQEDIFLARLGRADLHPPLPHHLELLSR